MTNTKKNDKIEIPEGQYVDPNQEEIDRLQKKTEEDNEAFTKERLKENRKRDRE